MIQRYTRPEMGAIWELSNKYQTWLEIEILACEAWAELGKIPREAVEEIRAKARIDTARILEIEKDIKHDMIAFVSGVAETVGEAGKYLHYGLTSYDVEDPALSLLMRQSADLLLRGLRELEAVLRDRAAEFKHTPMIGRTHGVHAEPTTFGLKLALWLDETRRNVQRMEQARQAISVGKLSGAVGTFANIDPFVERYVCDKLGLEPAPVSTQILQRDRHAQFLTTIAICASSLEKMATEIRNLQRTEIREVHEPFGGRAGAVTKGSSAMPHKRNPELSERVAGLSRVMRGNALAALENVALWHERDITNSSVERVIIPDSCILLDYVLDRFTYVLRGMTVDQARMRRNLEMTGGLVFSQQVMLALVEAGMQRERAYATVQARAMEAWEREVSFRELIAADEEVRGTVSPERLEEAFDLGRQLAQVDYIFRRVGL
ncbi:MAG: adenylosuccinate lyase [Bacillota bacterium]|nr:adenylosuccinate lyase [Bacillota bacterium]